MKRCPKCNLDYFDNALEFCLEDGAKLVSVVDLKQEKPTVTKSEASNPTLAETATFPLSEISSTSGLSDLQQAGKIQTTNFSDRTVKLDLVKETVTSQTYKILEVTPIVISLAFNWWQWLYLNNQYYSSLSSFLVSANFLMWLVLLISGLTLSFFALKKCENKGFAYTSLVILAINFILFLVPKR